MRNRDLERLDERIAKAKAGMARYADAKYPEHRFRLWCAAKGEHKLASYQRELLVRRLAELPEEVEVMNVTDEKAARPGRYVAARGFTASGVSYPRGAEVPLDELSKWRNGQSLLNNGTVAWSPIASEPAVKPRALTPSRPQPPRPRPVLVADRDPVEAWRKSVEATAATGEAALARDVLFATEEGAKLYRLAVGVDAERRAMAKRLPYVSREVRSL